MGSTILALSLALAPHFVNERTNTAFGVKDIPTLSQKNTPAPAERSSLQKALHAAS
jgi:hypothetical protein